MVDILSSDLAATPAGVHFASQTFGHEAGKRVFLLFSGLGNSGFLQFKNQFDGLKEHGDVMWYENPRDEFSVSDVIAQAYEAVKDYSEVCVIGASLGGLVAYDFCAFAQQQPGHPKLTAILVHPIDSWKHIRFRWPIIRAQLAALPFISDPGPIKGEDCDLEHLSVHQEYMNTFPFPVFKLQAKYIIRHPKLEPVYGVRAVIFRSDKKDVLVSAKAADAFAKALPESTIIPAVSRGHTDFVEQPGLWRRELKRAVEILYGR